MNDLAVSDFSTLPKNGRFSIFYLSQLGKISTAVSRDYASLMSPKKDETDRIRCCWSCGKVHYLLLIVLN